MIVVGRHECLAADSGQHPDDAHDHFDRRSRPVWYERPEAPRGARLVVRGRDGMDELSTASLSDAIQVHDGAVRERRDAGRLYADGDRSGDRRQDHQLGVDPHDVLAGFRGDVQRGPADLSGDRNGQRFVGDFHPGCARPQQINRHH